jgi:hypothetical protein
MYAVSTAANGTCPSVIGGVDQNEMIHPTYSGCRGGGYSIDVWGNRAPFDVGASTSPDASPKT